MPRRHHRPIRRPNYRRTNYRNYINKLKQENKEWQWIAIGLGVLFVLILLSQRVVWVKF